MPPISVAFDMTFANRNQGGSGAYARSLLASLRERDEVVPWVISGPRRSNFAGTMRWLVRGGRHAIGEKPPDLVHCPSFVTPWAISVPFVVTVHDAASKHFPGDHPLEWRVYVDRIMPRRLRAAARVITGSEFGRREVIGAFGLEPERVVAVPYGLDSRFLNFSPTNRPPANGAATLLFPGAPIGRKNLDSVLRAMAAASEHTSLGRAVLTISGANEADFPACSRLVRSLGLQARVRWLGQAPAADMPALYAGATALVYPSLYEGFGFPPLEAMAVGTPVVASDRGSLPEVLGDAAMMVDPTDVRALGDALEAVLTQPELRGRLRSAGEAQAKRYTWERCADGTIEVYREALGKTAVPS
ncbi:MAG: glycosyltransferase family 4 protein [Solirubrobacteraceae bacterium]